MGLTRSSKKWILGCFISFLPGHTQLVAQVKEAELTIKIEQEGVKNPAAWIVIESKDDDNIGGWYDREPKGFPAFSDTTLIVPVGELTLTGWSSTSNVETLEIIVKQGESPESRLNLKTRINPHEKGYFSFDSHNHLNGYEAKNRPPYIYPYCAAMGIDHLDVCQGL